MNIRLLPLRYRAALAGVLFVTAIVVGSWASTRVGDPDPTVWGLLSGVLAGAALAVAVLVAPLHRPSSRHRLLTR